MRYPSKHTWLLLFLFALAACNRQAPVEQAQLVDVSEVAGMQEGGAVSTEPVKPEPPPVKEPAKPVKPEATVDWSPLTLPPGRAAVSCELDYATQGDGEALTELGRDNVQRLLSPCVERGVMRLRYQGRIDADFTALVQRVAQVAEELGIGKRVLDVDSAGGQVEDAIEAGDFIAGSRWTIWVREGSVCHSACVFILGAGDVRMIAGQVGIHRIIRMSSTATTRAELNAELRVVYDRVRSYLERNGAAVAIADLMMAVPNRSLRLLTSEELMRYGLDGVNPAQDDLDRLKLMRKCGEDFVRRRDAFVRAFDNNCKDNNELDALNACGLGLRKQYGFPDAACPAESPLSEFDVAQDESPVEPGAGAKETAPASSQAGAAKNR